MEKQKKHCPSKHSFSHIENVYFRMPAASATEFTGLTPTVPETEEEAESYHEIMEVPVTAKDGAEVCKKFP